jgi:hypothetical protein
MTISKPFFRHSCTTVCFLILVVALSFGVLAGPVSAAPDQTNFEAYLGDTIDLHGVSYTGSQVYLFMTGPDLPANGVTLYDTKLRADQGHFTIVSLADDQTWSMKWDTNRIYNQIKPGGTYNIYVSPTPTDLSGLSGGYKELTIYLKDPGERNGVTINAQGAYTLNPENHISTAIPTTIIPTTTATPTPNLTTVATPVPTTPVPTALPTRKSGPAPFLAVIATAAGALVLVAHRKHP